MDHVYNLFQQKCCKNTDRYFKFQVLSFTIHTRWPKQLNSLPTLGFLRRCTIFVEPTKLLFEDIA